MAFRAPSGAQIAAHTLDVQPIRTHVATTSTAAPDVPPAMSEDTPLSPAETRLPPTVWTIPRGPG
eukprot:1644747-Pyramimonas_sp.AAC.1